MHPEKHFLYTQTPYFFLLFQAFQRLKHSEKWSIHTTLNTVKEHQPFLLINEKRAPTHSPNRGKSLLTPLDPTSTPRAQQSSTDS
jgi:hypothetical protein